ncbi:MAG: GNAT family N-acetyltransferase [Bacteroidales bacterium]|jgi:GNAT superfamily N-acetyltransferase
MKNNTSTDSSPDFSASLTFEPLSKSNWNEFVTLFGERGACGNCWCQAYRLPKAEFDAGKKNEGNKMKMKDLVWSNHPTGILTFHEREAIAWCSVAPREDFIRLERSRVHKRIDTLPVWSITCFFIKKKYRMKGISMIVLKAVIDHARKNGISILEAYPLKPTSGKLPDAFAWIGLCSTFEKAGFRIVDLTSKNRPMVRYYTDLD